MSARPQSPDRYGGSGWEDHPTRAGRHSPGAGDVGNKARLAERCSAERLGQIRNCTDGCCSVQPSDEVAVPCGGIACGRSLHLRSCAYISSDHDLVGRFVCHHCRLRAMGAEGEPLDEAIRAVVKTVLLELTTGRQATAAGHERFSRLADLFVSQQLQLGFTKFLPPQDSSSP